MQGNFLQKDRNVVLVTGDRNWHDKKLIFEVLDLFRPSTVIHGAARGADSLADQWAGEKEIPVRSFPANWEKYGRAAGPIRNQQMIESNPDVNYVLAFHDDLASGKGTKNMVQQSRKAGITVLVVTHGRWYFA